MNIIIKISLLTSFLFVSSVALSQSPPERNNSPKTIAFYLQDRVEVLDFAGPLEVFSYAGYEVFTVSKSKKAIKAQGVLTVKPDYTIKNAPKADILAFFGGNASSAYNDPEVIAWIRQQTNIAYYFSVCTGAFLLAEAGILDNKVATTFHNSLDKLEAKYPTTDVRRDVRFVDNGKVITTAGISAGIDGALHLVAKLQGMSAAMRTAYYMEYDNWVPGNGLILSDDNPYKDLPVKEDLQAYSGKYEYKDGYQMIIEAGGRSGELHAYLKGKKDLLFSEQKDTFSDTNGELIYFQRDKDKQVNGYTLEENGDVYKKEVYMCKPCGLRCDTLQFTSPGVCSHCSMDLIEKTVLNESYTSIRNFQKTLDASIGSPEKQPLQAFKIPNGNNILRAQSPEDFEILQKVKSTPLNNVNGIWESVGSGWVLQINDSSEYAFYDITTISCLPNRKGDFSEIEASLALNNDTLSLLKGVITYKFTKTSQLPELCQQPLDVEKAKGPLYNFEVFAETVKENYAFMDLNQIDWSVLYEQQKNKLNKKSTDAELYLVIEETLEKLNDNHAFLEANEEVYEEIELMMDKKEDIPGEENLPEIGDFGIANMVTKHHLEAEMTEDSWLIQWGKLNDDIGYIQIKSMWLYADLEIPKSLIDEIGLVDAYVKTFHKLYEGDYVEKEVIGVSKIMDKVMNDLSGMKSMVIDVRFNGGGQDAVSFEILSRFTPNKLQIATQKLRYGNQFSPIIPLYIKGTPKAYTKPVYVLTSQQTGSAAEAFAIATMSMKNVKRIGSPTSGAMSTALEKTLPNGWVFSISNEIYMDNQGNNFENKGIPVDYDLNYPEDRQTFFRAVAKDLDADKQSILNAIDELRKE